MTKTYFDITPQTLQPFKALQNNLYLESKYLR